MARPAVAGDFPVVLIGHSMGASVVLEAARLLGERVIGLVAVDALQAVADTVPDAASVEARVAPFEADYQPAARSFIERMFPEDVIQSMIEVR